MAPHCPPFSSAHFLLVLTPREAGWHLARCRRETSGQHSGQAEPLSGELRAHSWCPEQCCLRLCSLQRPALPVFSTGNDSSGVLRFHALPGTAAWTKGTLSERPSSLPATRGTLSLEQKRSMPFRGSQCQDRALRHGSERPTCPPLTQGRQAAGQLCGGQVVRCSVWTWEVWEACWQGRHRICCPN